jgi:hypothetical protein
MVALHIAENRKETKTQKSKKLNLFFNFLFSSFFSAERPEGEFSSSATLWQVLTHFATNFQLDLLSRCDDQRWLAPKLTILNRHFGGLDTLLSTSLQSAGVSSGRNLIRIAAFERSELSLDQVNARVASFAADSLAAKAAKSRPDESDQSDSTSQPIIVDTGPSDAVIAAMAAGEKEAAQKEAAAAAKKLEKEKAAAAAAIAAATAAAAAAASTAAAAEAAAVATVATVETTKAATTVTAVASPEPTTHEPIQFDAPIAVERNLRVLGVRALQSAAQRDAEVLPDSFYEVTQDDVKAVQASAQKRKQQSETLMTREMRDRDKKRYLKTKIRVKMPDRIEVEGTFSVLETIGDVKTYVREQLRDATWPFYLFVTPPRTILSDDDLTLGELELVPAALVLLAFGTPRAPLQVEQPFLKPELLANITEADFVDLTALPVAAEEAEKRATPVTANERIRSILGKLRKEKGHTDNSKAQQHSSNNDDDDGDNDADDKAERNHDGGVLTKVPKWLKLNKKK